MGCIMTPNAKSKTISVWDHVQAGGGEPKHSTALSSLRRQKSRVRGRLKFSTHGALRTDAPSPHFWGVRVPTSLSALTLYPLQAAAAHTVLLKWGLGKTGCHLRLEARLLWAQIGAPSTSAREHEPICSPALTRAPRTLRLTCAAGPWVGSDWQDVQGVSVATDIGMGFASLAPEQLSLCHLPWHWTGSLVSRGGMHVCPRCKCSSSYLWLSRRPNEQHALPKGRSSSSWGYRGRFMSTGGKGVLLSGGQGPSQPGPPRGLTVVPSDRDVPLISSRWPMEGPKLCTTAPSQGRVLCFRSWQSWSLPLQSHPCM